MTHSIPISRSDSFICGRGQCSLSMQEIIQRFAEKGYLIDPEALDLITSYSGAKTSLVKRVISSLDSSTIVVTVSDLRRSIEEMGSTKEKEASDLLQPDLLRPKHCVDSGMNHPNETKNTNCASHTQVLTTPALEGNGGTKASAIGRDGHAPLAGFKEKYSAHDISCASLELVFNPLANSAINPLSAVDHPSDTCQTPFSDFELLADITGKSTCVGQYQDFIKYFRDRYSKIGDILSSRLNARPIESLGKNVAGREISIIGMVMDIKTSTKGNKLVQLEDPTGMVMVIFKKGTPPFEESISLVSDEVIGVSGTTDGGGRVFANSLTWPDLQEGMPPRSGNGGALLMSDLHVGSKYFVEDGWKRFTAWINGEMDDPLELVSKVKYIVIAGDLVDGVGVYPGQEGDLSIMDIHQQYESAAELISEIPSRIQIVISPGNHDAVRQAEPQPAFPESIQKLFGNNCTFVGNPAWFKLGGIEWLVYHGRSMDDLVLKIPGLSYSEPEKVMVEMLKRRHLSPIYGNRVSIAPEERDILVIQRPPAVLHCGHVHTFGVTRYKGVTVINSGTWQGQTDFQKKMNIQPTAAIVPYLDLKTMRVRKLIFA